jgi:catechol 2,3-dioxygenase-like lactoylglutathione lyase family enzyme
VVGINHATRAVRDLDRSFDFYTGALGLRPIARWDGGAYLLAGNDRVALILDPETRRGPLPEYTHLAFYVSPAEFEETKGRLQGTGVWRESASEGESLYFLDPDGHSLEIRASHLASRLSSDRRNGPPGMRFFD